MLFRSQEKVKKEEIENWIKRKYDSEIEKILRDSKKYMEKIKLN